jgi:hypothetical protein
MLNQGIPITPSDEVVIPFIKNLVPFFPNQIPPIIDNMGNHHLRLNQHFLILLVNEEFLIPLNAIPLTN